MEEMDRGVLALAVGCDGTILQALQCDATQAPTRTIGEAHLMMGD